MSQDRDSDWFHSQTVARTAWKLASLGLTCNESATFLREAFGVLGENYPSRTLRWMRAERGDWRSNLVVGQDSVPPSELLADVLDAGRPAAKANWYVFPCGLAKDRTELLAMFRHSPTATPDPDFFVVIDSLLAAWRSVRELETAKKRLQRLEMILEIAGQWNQTRDMESLLHQMAEAATRLLNAERASIFLWDRQSHSLVGRPALGVDNGELRIPDDRGVVGQVIQTGQPRRVGAVDTQDEIDRTVDKKLRFRTRSLLCVPLFGKNAATLGAFELLNKRAGDFTTDDEIALTELATHAAVALQNTQQYQQLLRVRNQLADQAAEAVQLIGDCNSIRQLRDTARRVAETDLAVLILGENGTGKEVIARMVHYFGRRRNEPLVAVNCAAMPDTLLESELFGHERGAFTDAIDTRIGKFELAAGGTLFLDEIAEMSPGGQAKLLRVLEEKVIVRVGGSIPIRTEARVVAATNQNLSELVHLKRFREDLFFRLSVVTLSLPPLRSRNGDILLLAEHFLQHFSSRANRTLPTLTADARKRLLSHDWPGNIRELRNLMERLAYLLPTDKIEADDLSFVLTGKRDGSAVVNLEEPLTEATRQFQMDYIKRQIERTGGNMTDAAERLGLHRANLYRKMKQLGMDVDAT